AAPVEDRVGSGGSQRAGILEGRLRGGESQADARFIVVVTVVDDDVTAVSVAGVVELVPLGDVEDYGVEVGVQVRHVCPFVCRGPRGPQRRWWRGRARRPRRAPRRRRRRWYRAQ